MNGPFRDQTFTSSHAWYSRVPGCIFVHTVECKVAVVGCLNRQERLFITIKLWVSQFRSAFHIFLTSSFLTTAIVIIATITFDGTKKIFASHQMCVVTISSRTAKWGELRIRGHNWYESWQRRRKSMVQLENSNQQTSKKANLLRVP